MFDTEEIYFRVINTKRKTKQEIGIGIMVREHLQIEVKGPVRAAGGWRL